MNKLYIIRYYSANHNFIVCTSSTFHFDEFKRRKELARRDGWKPAKIEDNKTHCVYIAI